MLRKTFSAACSPFRRSEASGSQLTVSCKDRFGAATYVQALLLRL